MRAVDLEIIEKVCAAVKKTGGPLTPNERTILNLMVDKILEIATRHSFDVAENVKVVIKRLVDEGTIIV